MFNRANAVYCVEAERMAVDGNILVDEHNIYGIHIEETIVPCARWKAGRCRDCETANSEYVLLDALDEGNG